MVNLKLYLSVLLCVLVIMTILQIDYVFAEEKNLSKIVYLDSEKGDLNNKIYYVLGKVEKKSPELYEVKDIYISSKDLYLGNNLVSKISNIQYDMFSSREHLGRFDVADFENVQLMGFYNSGTAEPASGVMGRIYFTFKNGDLAIVENEAQNFIFSTEPNIWREGEKPGRLLYSGTNVFYYSNENSFGGKTKTVKRYLLKDDSELLLGYSYDNQNAEKLLNKIKNVKVNKYVNLPNGIEKSLNTSEGVIKAKFECFMTYYWGKMGTIMPTKNCSPNSKKLVVNGMEEEKFRATSLANKIHWKSYGSNVAYRSNESILGNLVQIK